MDSATTVETWTGATVRPFRTPTIGDIPGLQDIESLPQESTLERDARPLNYAEARNLLDFIARRVEGMGPSVRQLFDATLPTISDAYTSMLVEIDRLKAELEALLLAAGTASEAHVGTCDV